jgi:hypothetical protein
MKAIKWCKRIATALLVLCIVTLSVGPWAVYWLALQGLDGSPALPTSAATAQERRDIWQKVGGHGEPTIAAISPYRYFSLSPEEQAGVRLAWSVASNYNLEHLKYEGMFWWHFSGAALTIWLTRNWTTEQLLSKAVEIRRRNGSAVKSSG